MASEKKRVVAYRIPPLQNFKLYWDGNGNWDRDIGVARMFTSYMGARQNVTRYYGYRCYTIFVEEVAIVPLSTINKENLKNNDLSAQAEDET